MKRLLILLLLLLIIPSALAEDDLEALFLETHPGYEIEQSAGSGDTFAAILLKDDLRVLCVAERSDDRWTLTVDNDKALHGDKPYPYDYIISFSSDGELEWHATPQMSWYGPHETWRSVKAEGIWQFPTLTEQWYINDPARVDTLLSWCDGLLTRAEEYWAEGSETPAVTPLMPLPAAWTKDMTTLADFDLEARPRGVYDTQMLEGRAVIEAAAELKPDWTYLGGQLLDDHLQLLMDKPDGTRVLLIVTWEDDWRFVESTPLPQDAIYGQTDIYYELQYFSVGNCEIRRYPNGNWGVVYLFPYLGDFSLRIRPGMVSTRYSEDTPWLIPGEHPWGDITTIDWTGLPICAEHTWLLNDTSGWAMANPFRPNMNRVILYDNPSRDAGYLGEYLAGAPVWVLEQQEDWTRVDVFGAQGWMETDSLAFGRAMATVYPWLQYAYDLIASDGEDLDLYPSPGNEPTGTITNNAVIIGAYGDGWYHVYDTYTSQSGYVRNEPMTD